MRSLLALVIVAIVAAAPSARAGMRLTLVMIDPDQAASLIQDQHAVEKLLVWPIIDVVVASAADVSVAIERLAVAAIDAINRLK